MKLSRYTADQLIDFLLRDVCPKQPDTPPFRERMKAVINKLVEVHGRKPAEDLMTQWIVNNQGAGLTYEELLSTQDFYRKEKTKMMAAKSFKTATEVKDTANKELRALQGKVLLWEEIARPIRDVHVEGVTINKAMYEYLTETLPHYTEGDRVKLLKYLCSSFTVPMVITSENTNAAHWMLREIRSKVSGLTEACVISPKLPDPDLCKDGIWEDFPSWGVDKERRDIIRSEMSDMFPRMGLFALNAIDDVDNYDKDFKRLLKYYVFNQRCIIYVDRYLSVPTSHWLTRLLRCAITVKFDL